MEFLIDAIKQGIAPAIIVLIYLIAIKYLDSKRDAEQAKVSGNLVKSISDISTFLNSVTKHIIEKDKDKCESAIDNSFKSFCLHLITFVATTIVNNNVKVNKELILGNIKNIVTAEYYNVYTVLSDYTINEINVASVLKKEWIEEIEKTIIDIIYNESMDGEHKIISFNNQIGYQFKSYSTYIMNKVL